MAITDINISEQLETDAPSIKYTGNEGPQASPQYQQEQMIAQQIWEALGPEQQGQFQSFEQFFKVEFGNKSSNKCKRTKDKHHKESRALDHEQKKWKK